MVALHDEVATNPTHRAENYVRGGGSSRVSQPGSDTAMDIPRHFQSLVDFGSFKVPIGKGHTAESVDSVQNTADLPQTLFRNILVKRLLLVRGGLASSKKESFSDLEPVTGK